MNDPANKHNAPTKEVSLGDRSPWFTTSSKLSPYRNLYWCYLGNEPEFLKRSPDWTEDDPVMECPGCGLDVDTNGDDFDHTFMGHAVKPLSTWRPQQ